MQTPAFRNPSLKLLASILLGLTLTACGGGDGGSRLDGDIGTDPGNGGGDPGGDADNEPAQLGRGSADDFVAGEIEVGIGNDSTLSPGGSTTLTVTLVNGSGELVTSSVNVTFNSDCIASGRSILSGAAEVEGNSVSTNNGRAEVTYTADGCVGEDQITARATYEGVSAGSARANVTVESDSIQTVEFISAEPSLIGLKGTGGRETSRVSFRVLGSTGSPMRDIPVSFALQPGGVGGLALVNETAESNGNGEVSTTVQAGSVATSVRVTASTSTDTGTISTQSNELVVSTGIPDQNSMDIAADNLYPISWRGDGGRYVGTESNITVRLADAFNNTAPDGTAVTFTTSGGAIGSSCTTDNGACSVVWTSQSPYPESTIDFIVDETNLEITCPGAENCRSGRVQVLATAIGNESFTDLNNNGRYDHNTDVFLSDNSSGYCDPNRPLSRADNKDRGCDDLGTAYLDKNFNKEYDSSEEEIVTTRADEDSSGNDYIPGDGIYNGVLCSDVSEAAGECSEDSVTIRDELLLVMSCTSPLIMDDDGGLPGQEANINVGLGQTYTVRMFLADCNGNGMPPGTTVELFTGALNDGQAAVFPDGELSGSANGQKIEVSITSSKTALVNGSVRIIVVSPTPNGELRTAIPMAITVN